MLRALFGYALGRQDGLVVLLIEGEQDSHPVGTAVEDSDGEQLGHCEVGIMLRALVGNALGVDVGAVLGALVGNVLGQQDGLVFRLAEGEQDGRSVGTARRTTM
jgi:hypothetical protein